MLRTDICSLRHFLADMVDLLHDLHFTRLLLSTNEPKQSGRGGDLPVSIVYFLRSAQHYSCTVYRQEKRSITCSFPCCGKPIASAALPVETHVDSSTPLGWCPSHALFMPTSVLSVSSANAQEQLSLWQTQVLLVLQRIFSTIGCSLFSFDFTRSLYDALLQQLRPDASLQHLQRMGNGNEPPKPYSVDVSLQVASLNLLAQVLCSMGSPHSGSWSLPRSEHTSSGTLALAGQAVSVMANGWASSLSECLVLVLSLLRSSPTGRLVQVCLVHFAHCVSFAFDTQIFLPPLPRWHSHLCCAHYSRYCQSKL